MNDKLKNINDLELFLNDNQVFDLVGADSIGVFGSFARGEDANDIDILLENTSNKEHIIAIQEDLEKKSGKKFDVVISETANPIILHRAKKDLVYVKKHQK